jgi:predicted O-methyltransferase YrrM
MNFEEAFKFTDGIAGLYSRLNCEKLWEYASRCNGLMVEVGVLNGRSASLMLQAAQETGAVVILVDCWKWMKGHAVETMKVVDEFPEVKKAIFYMYSKDAIRYMPTIDLLHIDANHQEEGIKEDCQYWLPAVSRGGIACFHDYGADIYPGIKKYVDFYTHGWEDLGVWDTLAIRRRP